MQDTEAFCRRTLCNSDLAHYLNSTFVCWGGDVRYPDAYKLSNRCAASDSSGGPLTIFIINVHNSSLRLRSGVLWGGVPW